MRVPLSWLADFVDVDLTPEALAERLTLLGMEVKGIERRGADWSNVVVGELLTVERHPRADRLSLTTVTIGAGEPLSIVCGATNIAPGQRIPVALPGAILPGDRRIDRTEKMGVVSNGMLCSGDELRLTGDADGILILPADVPLGAAIADLYGDVVLDVDVKPNRGDALSILGLAREVAAVTGAPLRISEVAVDERGGPVSDRLAVDVVATDLCSRFVGRWVSGVTVGPSPDRVQMRLLAAGVRPISNVVDASNYVMLELGKPIHTFDGSAIRDGRIIVRRAASGERLETLDHVIRDLDPDMLLIADPSGPLAIAGVMGGAASEVSAATTEVAIESAIFDPVSIRTTAFRTALRSEASLRFEKGQEHRLARVGADRTAELVAAWAGGTIATGVVDTDPLEPAVRRLPFRPVRVNRILGTTLSSAEQAVLLARVGVATSEADDGSVRIPIAAGSRSRAVDAPAREVLVATIPTWRRDLEVEADIAEEVARIHGYDRIPSILPHTAMAAHRPSPLEIRDTLRRTLAGAGLTEVVTHALVPAADAAHLVWAGSIEPAAGEGRALGAAISARNPLSLEHAVLRRSLVGSLLDVIATNARRGRGDVAVFEIGKGYGAVEAAPVEWWRLGIAIAGSFDVPAWNRSTRPVDLDDAKGIIETIADALGHGRPSFTTLTGEPLLHPGRSALVTAPHVDGRHAMTGRVGEVHPTLLEGRDVRVDRVVLAELSIAGLEGGQIEPARLTAPSRFPAVGRDIAVVLSDATTVASATAAIVAGGGALLRSVSLFDVYRGAPLGVGERSLAFRLVFTTDRTLTEVEVDGAMASIVGALAVIGGRLRT